MPTHLSFSQVELALATYLRSIFEEILSIYTKKRKNVVMGRTLNIKVKITIKR